MASREDKKPRRLPKELRASVDPSDEAGYQRLQENDEVQRELAERINAPFTSNTPLERRRSKAYITIQALEDANLDDDDTMERLAEAYATIGRYDTAATISPKHADVYEKYWTALHLPDEEWCEHVEKHKFTKEIIFSIPHGREMPLLACNICGLWNVADTTYELDQKQRREDSIRAATKHLDKDATLAYLKQHVKPV